jgi:hypothetical protein
MLDHNKKTFRNLSDREHVETTKAIDVKGFAKCAKEIPSLLRPYAEFHKAVVFEAGVFKQQSGEDSMREAREATDNAYLKMQFIVNSLLLTESSPDKLVLLYKIVEDVNSYLSFSK